MFDTHERLKQAGARHVLDQKRQRELRIQLLKGRCHEMTAREASDWFRTQHQQDVSFKTCKQYARELGERFIPEPPKPPKPQSYDEADEQAVSIHRRMMTLWPVRQGECYE
jgi:hypothetical protein